MFFKGCRKGGGDILVLHSLMAGKWHLYLPTTDRGFRPLEPEEGRFRVTSCFESSMTSGPQFLNGETGLIKAASRDSYGIKGLWCLSAHMATET